MNKKKIAILLLLSMVLTACGSKSVKKIEKDLPYVYAEKTDSITFEAFLESAGLFDQESFRKKFDSNYPLAVNQESMYKVSKIVLNFESEDANELQRELDARYQSANEFNQSEKGLNSNYQVWRTFFLYDYVETDAYFSFRLVDGSVALASHGQLKWNHYVFDKKTGEELDDDDILELFNKDERWLENTVASMLEEASYLTYNEDLADDLSDVIEDGFAASKKSNNKSFNIFQYISDNFRGSLDKDYVRIKDDNAIAIDADGNLQVIVEIIGTNGVTLTVDGYQQIMTLPIE